MASGQPVSNMEKQLITSILNTLNDLHGTDPEAMKALIETRVKCNEKMADHGKMLVQDHQDGTFSISIMGIINAVIGLHSSGTGYVAAEYFGEELEKFSRNPATVEDEETKVEE